MTVVTFIELDPGTLDESVHILGLVAEFVGFGLGEREAH
jgi:hypothetical protein